MFFSSFQPVGRAGGGTFYITPGLTAALADDTVVIVDPYQSSGYSRSTYYPAANIGRDFPNDSTSPYIPADAYFFDIRRANGNRGVRSTSGTTARYDRFTVNYEPRPIAKIDFDMTRFKMMVTRIFGSNVRTSANNTSVSAYEVRAPNTSSPNNVTWNNSIFNSAGTRTTLAIGIWDSGAAAFNRFPANTNADTMIRLDPYNLYYAPTDPEGTDLSVVVDTPMDQLVPESILYDGSTPDAWYDGFAVYLNSLDAEHRAQTSGVPDRVDSGVRMWNGRGPAASLNIVNVTGFTMVTNDALYTIGHFNADGSINATTSSTLNPGGYSAVYPGSADERLTSLMGDAYTALSQPTWTNNTSGQASGCNHILNHFFKPSNILNEG